MREETPLLVGESGVLTWFHPSLSAPPFPNDPDILSDMKASDSGITRTRIDGRNLLLSYEKIPGSQMFAAYVADLDMLLSNAYRIRNLCFFVFLCVVIGKLRDLLLCDQKHFQSPSAS